MQKYLQSLSDNEALQVMALCERKAAAEAEKRDIECRLQSLKEELLELSDTNMAKDFNCKSGVIFSIRNGKSYKHLRH